MSKTNDKYIKKLTEWVVDNFCDQDDRNPSHCQFSAVNVADIIATYIRDKNSGKIWTQRKLKNQCIVKYAS